MKGTLVKTEQGWVVEHKVAEKTPIGYKSWWGTFPLHPDDHRDYVIDNNGYFYFYDGKEVQFDFVTEWENGEVGVNGLTYAKLINHSVEPKETLYTEEQLRAAMKYASEITNNKIKYMENYIQSLKQPK
jgi:hypothetical protein